MLAGPQGSLKKTCPHRCHQHPESLTPAQHCVPHGAFQNNRPPPSQWVPVQPPEGSVKGTTLPCRRPGKSPVLSLQRHLPGAALARACLCTARQEAGLQLQLLQLPPSRGCILPRGPGGRCGSAPSGPLTALTSQGDAVPVSPGPPRHGGARRLSSQRSPAAGSTLEPRRSRSAEGAEQTLP